MKHFHPGGVRTWRQAEIIFFLLLSLSYPGAVLAQVEQESPAPSLQPFAEDLKNFWRSARAVFEWTTAPRATPITQLQEDLWAVYQHPDEVTGAAASAFGVTWQEAQTDMLTAHATGGETEALGQSLQLAGVMGAYDTVIATTTPNLDAFIAQEYERASILSKFLWTEKMADGDRLLPLVEEIKEQAAEDLWSARRRFVVAEPVLSPLSVERVEAVLMTAEQHLLAADRALRAVRPVEAIGELENIYRGIAFGDMYLAEARQMQI